jgi:hypothetical protein
MEFQNVALGPRVALSEIIMVAFFQSALAFAVIVFSILHALSVREEPVR